MEMIASRPLSFFRVLLGDFQEKMPLPRAWIREFDGEVPKKLVLRRSDTGISWTVSVKKIDNDFFLCKEWQNFAKDNGLQRGEFVVFVCNDISDFTVQIFGTDECAKEATLAKKIKLEESTLFHPEIRCKSHREEVAETGRMTSFPDERKGGSVKAAKTGSQRSFTLTYGASNVAKLILPRAFSRKYLRRHTQDVILGVPNGGAWRIRCAVGAHHVLTTGWKGFCIHNNFKEGDVCTFKLVDKKNRELKLVSVVRPRARRGGRGW